MAEDLSAVVDHHDIAGPDLLLAPCIIGVEFAFDLREDQELIAPERDFGGPRDRVCATEARSANTAVGS